MMSTDHPITPPPELVQQWWEDPCSFADSIKQAARWGADQELEACCHLLWLQGFDVVDDLRATRRPKPPSLKEQALAELAKVDVLWDTDEFGDETNAALDTIRRALEALPE